MINKNVAIIGASKNGERYSHKAILLLSKHGYDCFLINPNDKDINGIKVYSVLSDVEVQIDTVTLYVGFHNQVGLYDQIVNKKCRRVIFNPGTENIDLEKSLTVAGVEVVRACTLIMLQENSFE
jgi:hypothetical protein